MKTIHSKLTLKRATLIAAIGTTVYTFFVPVCRILSECNAQWFNYAAHPWLYNAWHLFFSCLLMVSWAVFALGIIYDKEHLPILSKGFRYVLLAFVVVSCTCILCHPPILTGGRWMIYADLWQQLLFLIMCDVVLWHIYAHIHTARHPHLPHWQNGLCWATVVLTLLVVAKDIFAVLWYVQSVDSRLSSREIYYNASWICNWLTYFLPVVFYFLLFLQPITTRNKS